METALIVLAIIFLILFVFLPIRILNRLNSLSKQLNNVQNTISDLKTTVEQLKIQPPSPIPTPEPIAVAFKAAIIPPKPIIIPPIEPKIVEIKSIVEPEPSFAEEFEAEAAPIRQSWWEKFREQNPDLEQFVGENLINKLGVLILVLGISYFVKFAIDKNWINETARVGIGLLCGAAVMGFAHRLRANYKAFSSVLVAGAIAIFYFTIAIAFHEYHIFSQTVAFALMVMITAFSVLISVSYDRMELAILSLIGGFAVPFMLSTGSGNYQVLFSYITILDLGILAIAYHKKWNLVNVLAFIFTTTVYIGWFILNEMKGTQPYFGAFVFATIFYFVFALSNIINNLRTQGVFSKIELSVLVANTAVYFSVGMMILSNVHSELKGVFCISLATFNFVLVAILYKKFGLDKRAVYLLIGLTLTFVTLSIPIQFNGNSITLFWAAEAVLLLWLSQRSEITQFRFTSVIVHVLMLGSLLMDWEKIYHTSDVVSPISLNSGFITGIFATISLFLTNHLLKNETAPQSIFGISLNPIKHRTALGVGAVLVLYFTGFLEAQYQGVQHFANFHAATSLPVAYHLVFCAILVFFLKKSSAHTLAIGLSLANIVAYILLFSRLPLEELKESFNLSVASNVAFLLHYVSLACVIFFGWVVWKDGKTTNSFNLSNKNWFSWLAAAAVVVVCSSEVLVHGSRFLTQPIASASADQFQIYQKNQNFLVKVAFPILWGMLAFMFLTIGIKNQWRNLRIIALALLGITIVKLFVYDISTVSETGKIIAFILLGVLILVMSFAYQKIKKIVLTDEKHD
jgi:uncharacterized membrane protein